VQITVELPNDLTQHADPAREAVEAVAIAGYRAGSLTAYEAQRLLGFQTRFEFEGFLKERGIYDHTSDVADLDENVENALRVARKRQGD
jgi:predicted HTH domain antitoxin